MKIERVEAQPLNVPLHEPFTIALGTISHATNVLVKVYADGLVGCGEAAPVPFITGETQETVLAALRTVGPLLVGRDATDIDGIYAFLDRALVGNTAAKAGLDCALWDLLAQRAGLPVSALLGGAPRPLETDMTIGIVPAERAAELARHYVQQGFRALKIKVGGDPEADVRRVQAVRNSAGPDIEIRVDANQGWNRSDAVKALQKMADLGVALVEQPLHRDDLEGLALLRQHVPIPVMLDESVFSARDALRAIKERAADIINIKLAKSSGISGARRIAAVCEAAGVRCLVGCMVETRLGISAAAHFAAAHRIVVACDLDSALYLAEDPVEGGTRLENGTLHLGEAAGLGVTAVKT